MHNVRDVRELLRCQLGGEALAAAERSKLEKSLAELDAAVLGRALAIARAGKSERVSAAVLDALLEASQYPPEEFAAYLEFTRVEDFYAAHIDEIEQQYGGDPGLLWWGAMHNAVDSVRWRHGDEETGPMAVSPGLIRHAFELAPLFAALDVRGEGTPPLARTAAIMDIIHEYPDSAFELGEFVVQYGIDPELTPGRALAYLHGNHLALAEGEL